MGVKGQKTCTYNEKPNDKENKEPVKFYPGNQYWKLAKRFRDNLVMTPEQLIKEVQNYIYETIHNPIEKESGYINKEGETRTIREKKMRPLTIKGFCAYLGVSNKMFYDWEKKESFVKICAWARDLFWSQKFEGAAVREFDANLIAREIELAEVVDGRLNLNAKIEIKSISVGDLPNDDEFNDDEDE